MKKIRVAFFAEILFDDFDGAVRTMYQLINRIDKTRFKFLFVYGAGPNKIAGHGSIKLPTIHLPINTNYTMALPGLAKKELKKTLKDFDPDVIHIATPSLLGAYAIKYANKRDIPVISIYHTHFISYIDYYFKYAPFLVGKVKQAIAGSQKAFYNNCSQIYVPAERMRTELEGMGVASHRMKIWKRGIDTQLFSPEKADPELLYKLTGNYHPTIIFASRLVWEKNLETLFRIYDAVIASGLKVNFLIAGDGVAAKACKAKMKNAVFTNMVDHNTLAVLYASASLFLFTSVSEAYGNVVLEAMASGLPCVIADGGGSADFIDQGHNGFKCEPFNEQDYLARIKQLLEDEHLRSKFIVAGLEYSQRMSWEQLAATYFDDLTSLSGKLKPMTV